MPIGEAATPLDRIAASPERSHPFAGSLPMSGLVLYVSVIAVVAVAATVMGIGALLSTLGWRAPSLLLSGLLLILGTAPAAALALLWLARASDLRWAMSGPGPFAFVGSATAMAAATLACSLWTAGCWVAAVASAVATLRGRPAPHQR